jgi:hypothetical protein
MALAPLLFGMTAPQIVGIGGILVGLFTGKYFLMFFGGALFALPFILTLHLSSVVWMVIVLLITIVIISGGKKRR